MTVLSHFCYSYWYWNYIISTNIRSHHPALKWFITLFKPCILAAHMGLMLHSLLPVISHKIVSQANKDASLLLDSCELKYEGFQKGIWSLQHLKTIMYIICTKKLRTLLNISELSCRCCLQFVTSTCNPVRCRVNFKDMGSVNMGVQFDWVC